MTERIEFGCLITEFAGEYPDVALFSDIDRAALTEGDAAPMFVTLKIGRVGAISSNQNLYDEAFVADLERQVREMRPAGNRGHVPDFDRESSYPVPNGYWVGTARVGELLWGKAYVPPSSPLREESRIRKATNSRMATSIYGTGARSYDGDRDAFRVTEFKLETLDFAPAERAGIASLAGVPHITSEMDSKKEESEQDGGNDPVDKLQVFQEMVAEDAKFLPDAVRNAILAASEDAKLVGELRSVLGDGDLVGLVKELRQAAIKANEAAIEAALVTEISAAVLPGVAETDAEDDPVKSVRRTVREIVVARKPEGPHQVKALVEEVAKESFIQRMVKAAVVEEMGEPQGKPIQNRKADEGEHKYVRIPKIEAES